MSRRSPDGFTPTQQRIMNVLSDGKPHLKDELVPCLGDSLAGAKALAVHMTYLRQILRPRGEDIFCIQTRGPARYVLVLLVDHPANAEIRQERQLKGWDNFLQECGTGTS